MKALTYIEHGKFALTDKPKPQIINARDAIVRVTLGSICTSDLHIKHGSVPRAVPGITVGHEMVGIVEEVGAEVTNVKPGDRVTVNVETFCGECFFCKHGFVNNCTDKNGGWALGCRIDGGQAEFVRVPYADQGLNKIPDSVTDEQALFVGDILATGFWAARISEITNEDTVLIIGAGPTGICTLLCVMLKQPKRIIVCEKDPARVQFVKEHYPDVLLCQPEECENYVHANSDHGGADVVLEVAGAKDTFQLAWMCARPNAVVTVVALYDEAQALPLPDMYGKGESYLHIGPPKTKTSARTIPVPSLLMNIIKKFYTDNPNHYFLTGKTKPTEPRTYRQFFTRFLKRNGLEKVKFHEIRHTFAVRAIEIPEFDIKSLSEILGHKNVSFTLNVYGSANLQQKVKCMNLLNDLL